MNPEAFAAEWIAAWNAHDLDRILSHYAPDVVFHSPLIIKRGFDAKGRLQGHDALRAYWGRAFVERPDLKFELIAVYSGARWISIRYWNAPGREAVETFQFGAEGRVIQAAATYAP